MHRGDVDPRDSHRRPLLKRLFARVIKFIEWYSYREHGASSTGTTCPTHREPNRTRRNYSRLPGAEVTEDERRRVAEDERRRPRTG